MKGSNTKQMADTPLLKIAALDQGDLAVISAHLQDAVLRVGDLRWMKSAGKLALVANRFDHFGDKAGSGAHYNVSLAAKDGSNLFDVGSNTDPRNCGLTELGYQFIGGVMRHLPAIQAVAAPTVNSYKRLILKGSSSGYTWAPCFVSYGNNNRTNTIRIPSGGGRVELRSADSACNPYLGIAMMIAAGLEGISEKIDPGEPHRDNLYTKSDEERSRKGVVWLPRTLEEAVDEFEQDPLGKEVFGELMFDSWRELKRAEWLGYLNHVSDWERERYLKRF